MAVTKEGAATVNDAATYAYNSYLDAKKYVCPSAASNYLQLYNNIRGGALGPQGAKLTVATKQLWLSAIEGVDTACKNASDYWKKSPVKTTSSGLVTPSPSPISVSPLTPTVGNGGSKPPVSSQGVTAGKGSSWILWLLGGAALFLVLGKKGRKK